MLQADLIRDTNVVYITGKVKEHPTLVYNQHGYDIYESCLEVPRLSGTIDMIPIISTLDVIGWLKVGDRVTIDGSLLHRGKVKYPNTERRLVVYVNSARIALPSWQNENSVTLTGHLCRAPQFRKTPKGSDICELLIAVANGNGSQEYCFCVTFGATARYASVLKIGAFVNVAGRFQSRDYRKQLTDGNAITKTAYEIALYSLRTKL